MPSCGQESCLSGGHTREPLGKGVRWGYRWECALNLKQTSTEILWYRTGDFSMNHRCISRQQANHTCIRPLFHVSQTCTLIVSLEEKALQCLWKRYLNMRGSKRKSCLAGIIPTQEELSLISTMFLSVLGRRQSTYWSECLVLKHYERTSAMILSLPFRDNHSQLPVVCKMQKHFLLKHLCVGKRGAVSQMYLDHSHGKKR